MDQLDFDAILDHILLDEAPGDNSAASLNRQELGMLNRYGAQNFAPSRFNAPTPQMQQRWNGAPARPGMMGQAAPAAAGPAARAPMRGGHGPANPPAGAVPPLGAGQPDAAQNGQVARTGAADRVADRYPAQNGQVPRTGTADRVADRYPAAPAAAQGGGNPLGFMNNPSSFRKTGNAPDAQASVSGGSLNNPAWFKPSGSGPNAQSSVSGGPPASPSLATPAAPGSLNNPSWFKPTGNAPDAQTSVSGGSAPSPSLAAPAAPGAPNLGVGGAM